jgi:hypothetical protein
MIGKWSRRFRELRGEIHDTYKETTDKNRQNPVSSPFDSLSFSTVEEIQTLNVPPSTARIRCLCECGMRIGFIGSPCTACGKVVTDTPGLAGTPYFIDAAKIAVEEKK